MKECLLQSSWANFHSKSFLLFEMFICNLCNFFKLFFLLLEPFFFLEKSLLAFLTAFKFCLKNSGDFISSPFDSVKYTFNPLTKLPIKTPS